MERKLKILYFANLITIFGSAFLFIPISKNFSIYFGVGMSWAMVYFIMRSPPVFLSRVYANAANKFGLTKTITYSQLFAMLSSIVLLVGVYYKINLLAIVGFALVCSFSLTLRTLYPSLLNLLSENKKSLQKHIADWQTVIFGAAILGIGIGGVLYEYCSMIVFVLVDLVTFLTAFLIWYFTTRLIKGSISNIKTESWSLAQFVQLVALPLNLVIFFKKLAYGFINPMMAVIFLEKFELSTATFSLLFSTTIIFSIIASRTARHIKISYNYCLLFSVVELALGTYFIVSNYLVLSVICFFMSSFFMVFADVNTETLYLGRFKKKGSNNLASMFSAMRNGGQLVGFVVFMIVAEGSFNLFLVSAISVITCCILSLLFISLSKYGFIYFKEELILKG
ncbi:MAG: hypothetical protein ABII18_10855 [bacterium]